MEEPSPANVFTPNDDNTNDVWEITNLPNNTQVHIYNRWGLEVAGTAKAKTIFKWDGRTTSGIHCTEGTYYYIISTEEKTFKGYLQLVR
jgi:gliding motility-associated-like protein